MHTSVTQETTCATELFDLSLGELDKLLLNATKSMFAPFDKRIQIVLETIKPCCAAAQAAMP